MNELIDRLTNRLESLADTSDAHRDVDSVMAGTPRNRPETITARQPRRTIAKVAAVAIALAGVGGIIALTATHDSPATQAPIETSPAPVSLPDVSTPVATTQADTTRPAGTVPEFDAATAVDPAELSDDTWLIPGWLPDDYELVVALDHRGEPVAGAQAMTFRNSSGDSIAFAVTSSPAQQTPQPWTRRTIGDGYEASARFDSIGATIHASRIDAASFNKLVAETRVGTLDDVPEDALITFPDPDPGEPVATYDADGVTVALYAQGVNGYYCLEGVIGVCSQRIPDGEIMTSHGGGATAGVTGSTTVTSTATGIVDASVDRIEVEFIDGQRISVQPTDLTGRYDERFWLVRTDIELDEPQRFGESIDTVSTVTAYDSDGNILHVDTGL